MPKRTDIQKILIIGSGQLKDNFCKNLSSFSLIDTGQNPWA